jgi:hypothetical protein
VCLGHLLPQKGNCEIKFNYICFVLYFVCLILFEIWTAILNKRDFLEAIAINPSVTEDI